MGKSAMPTMVNCWLLPGTLSTTPSPTFLFMLAASKLDRMIPSWAFSGVSFSPSLSVNRKAGSSLVTSYPYAKIPGGPPVLTSGL